MTSSAKQIKFYSPTSEQCLSHSQVIHDYFVQYRLNLRHVQSLGKTYIEWPDPIEASRQTVLETRETRSKASAYLFGGNSDESSDDFEIKTKKRRRNVLYSSDPDLHDESCMSIRKSFGRKIVRDDESGDLVESGSKDENIVEREMKGASGTKHAKENYFVGNVEDGNVCVNLKGLPDNRICTNVNNSDSDTDHEDSTEKSENQGIISPLYSGGKQKREAIADAEKTNNGPGLIGLDSSTDSDFVAGYGHTAKKKSKRNMLCMDEIEEDESDEMSIVPPVFGSPSKTPQWSLFSDNEGPVRVEKNRAQQSDGAGSERGPSLRKRKPVESCNNKTTAFDRIFCKKSRTGMNIRDVGDVDVAGEASSRHTKETVILSDDDDDDDRGLVKNNDGAAAATDERRVIRKGDNDDSLPGSYTDCIETVVCPLCGALYSKEYIERHADKCVGKTELPTLGEKAATSTKGETPSKADEEQTVLEECILCHSEFPSGHDMEAHFEVCFSNRTTNTARITRSTRGVNTYSKKHPVASSSSKKRDVFDFNSQSDTDG